MRLTLATAAITANSIAGAVQGYVTFESPASRYGHYDPDFRQLATDPYVTSRCATRDASPFPGATTVWHAGSQPCITLKEIGPFQSAAYKVTLLDAAGAPVYVEDFATAPLGNTMDELHQTLDTQTGLPVFDWCDRDRHHDHDQHDRNCVPRNDLVVAKRRLTLTLPKDVASVSTHYTLQLAATVDGGAPHFACANVDVVESGEIAEGKADSAEAVCESEPAELTRYAAAVASVWAIFAFYSLWKWTVVAYLVAHVVVFIVAGILGKREKTRLAEVGDSSDSLPVYDMFEQISKGVEAGMDVTDPEAPHASLITDNGANGSDDAVGVVQGKSGQYFSRRAGQCGHGKCEPSALRVGLHMAGPRRARRCMGGLCALLSIGYILTGIIGGLMILHYQA